MRIATWNLAYGTNQEANRRRLKRMRAVDADVWVLTETHDSLDLEGDGYTPVHGDNRPIADSPDNIDEQSRWVSIWSRLPVKKSDASRSDPRRTAALVSDGDGNGTIGVYGTVLPWIGDKATGGMEVVLAEQTREWAHLNEEANLGFCVAGDFNVNLGGPHYYGSNDSKQAVQDALDTADLVAMTRYDNTPERLFGIIDHIAVPEKVASGSELFCIWGDRNSQGQKLSDHSGAAVDVDAWAGRGVG